MDLYYEVEGKGHPVVLLTGGADLRNWTFVSPLLAKHFKVIGVDGRGTGESPTPVEDITLVEDLLSLLDHLELDKATLIGHSMGGQLATEFALHYPERVSKLVLIAPGLSGFSYSQEFEEYTKSIQKAVPDIDKMIEQMLSASWYRVLNASSHRDLMVQILRHQITRMFEWPAVKMIWPEPPAIDRLEELAAETLLLIGTEDSPDILRVADYFQENTDAQIIKIPDVDHMVTLTNPEVLYRHITNFMEDDLNDAKNIRRE
ncbi:alpha/beta fold hydrolase [Virgibacillus doumboii]|uniref:alpha/beta fold hydrolase n=1 Tax=Virgibacillus doumboii TaxID=2697503 RepID=UPI0013DFF500|nr:alpha/beta hydrolase [Virgibacillus doumboii]